MNKLVLGVIGMGFLIYVTAKKAIVHNGFFNDFLKTDYNFDQYDNHIAIEATANGVDPKVLKAIGLNESLMGYDGGHEAIGNTQNVMHVVDATASRFGITREQMNDPKYSIKAAAKYLSFLKREFSGNLDHMVMAYNGGEGRMRQILSGDSSPKVLRAQSNMENYLTRFKRNLERLGA